MRALPLLLILLIPACGWVSFGRKVSDDEMRLRTDVRSYYDEVVRAFAMADAEALTRLFDPGIAKPMTREHILAWGKDFFAKNGPASFKIDHIEYERLGFENAVVLLSYHVETKDAKGDFGATERDQLVKHGRQWTVTSWEKSR